ncbi:MAG: tRNA1(Val) (adenine(37)-N6)-methyltransferase [Nitrospiraceae bacterium]|nr:tRNA1(Val) (adenine(37)-N6)-methyltransferase [Nitrospiraceae bacterium]
MELTLDTIANIKLYQHKKGYRFSVDALILYSFVNLLRSEKIVDLGAGSGIIGILLAKKFLNSEITLIELQEKLSKLAQKNIKLNELDKRVEILNFDIKKISSSSSEHDDNMLVNANSYDLVVSNPPFRRTQTGFISPVDEKAVARHELMLKIDDLADAARYLLKNKGRFCIIYHPSRLLELIDILRKKQLEPKRLCLVYSNQESEAKMVLVEAVKNGRPEIKIEKPLYLYKKNGEYTEQMQKLYKTGNCE